MNKKLIALILSIALTPSVAIAATPKPTQAQIDAAKKIEAEKKAAADAAAKKLNSAKKTLRQLTDIANAKRRLYVAAQNELKEKTKKAEIALKHLQAAQESVSSGKRTIGKLVNGKESTRARNRTFKFAGLQETFKYTLSREQFKMNCC